MDEWPDSYGVWADVVCEVDTVTRCLAEPEVGVVEQMQLASFCESGLQNQTASYLVSFDTQQQHISFPLHV